MHPLKPLNNTNIKSYTSKLYLQKSANFTSLYAYTKTLNKQSKHLTPCHMQNQHSSITQNSAHINISQSQLYKLHDITCKTNIKKKQHLLKVLINSTLQKLTINISILIILKSAIINVDDKPKNLSPHNKQAQHIYIT